MKSPGGTIMSIKFKNNYFTSMKSQKLFGLTLVVMILTVCFNLAAFAGTAFSPYWNTDSGNNWHYTLANGQLATDAWIQDEVSGDWYLIDSTGNMKSGLVTSNGKYYLLDNTRGTGHFGKLLKNGETYNGITIYADTSASYQGALNDITLNQLANVGVSVYTAQNVTGTKHVSNGTIISGGSGTAMIGNTVSDPTLQQTNAGNTNVLANVANPNGSAAATGNTSSLEKYHNKQKLSQSEINTLASMGVPVVTQDFVAATPPYSQDMIALINYVDVNRRLVLAGDDVDPTGCYDMAAYGHVGVSNIQEAMSYGSMHK